ncbi:MAG TPA: undecaprenyldiphospho-muramoylpentapeptide beta-N-acetylglucosaminyltransferase [Longimicrobiales bacterium]|nr:undecaprenyldiphospho-muramoylpentapeptide beta-N-acetylglucosaminyltransferase [Longimicrobiales bacterium]
MTRVVLAGGGTGGHLYPALALGAAIREARPDVRIFYIGARRGIEARVLPEKGVAHRLLPLEPLRRDRVWQNWRLPVSLARSLAALRAEFRRDRPALVVCTGGYASGPAGFWALVSRVPIALQEQNSYPGLTIRLLGRRARQIHLGFPEAKRHLEPGERTEVFYFGNPIQPPDPTIERREARHTYGLSDDGLVLLVVGGSQGAKALNDALASALEMVARGELEEPANLEILWATGPAHISDIDQRLAAAPSAVRVRARGYIDDMPRALAASDLALSRAGAMMTAELQAWGIPMLLVPLPTAAADHQTHNAVALDAAGAGVHLRQSALTPESLWNVIVSLVKDPVRRDTMGRIARERGRPDAASSIAAKLVELLPEAA